MIPISNPKRQFQAIEKELVMAFREVLNSGNYIMGSHVNKLEEAFAKKLGVSHAISVANGTDALVLTLEALGITVGDEVITTPFTFFATGEAIARLGATPVFVDIDETYNLDPEKIESKITEKTRAILPVHLFGQPAKMNEINQIARKHGLYVVEDACQAFGAKYNEKMVGSLGDAACFSFFPTKNFSTMGDGGIVTTSNSALAEKIKSQRVHGSIKKYFHSDIGYNSRLDEMHAAILLHCLDYIDEWNEARRELAQRYVEKLNGISSIKLPSVASTATHVYHLFSIEVNEREKLIDYLTSHQIQTGVYYPQPLHLQTAFQYLEYKIGDFPIAEKMSSHLLALPLFPYMTSEEQEKVIAHLIDFEVNQ